MNEQIKKPATMEELAAHLKTVKASDVIYAMIAGLENPRVTIDMNTFGEIRSNDEVRECYGCAALCAILSVADITPEKLIEETIPKAPDERSEAADEVLSFERAIDYLRNGNIEAANSVFQTVGFPNVKIQTMEGLSLSLLKTYYHQTELNDYRKLADYNKQLGN